MDVPRNPGNVPEPTAIWLDETQTHCNSNIGKFEPILVRHAAPISAHHEVSPSSVDHILVPLAPLSRIAFISKFSDDFQLTYELLMKKGFRLKLILNLPQNPIWLRNFHSPIKPSPLE